jgi:uncharacterized zinc-type alcohol dehydrogenase-like protein
VTKFKVGDTPAVGCLVDSCRTCPSCQDNLEQFCAGVAGGHLRRARQAPRRPTYGGYSESIVVDEASCCGAGQPRPAGAAPLLCAGITTYSPLRTGRSAGKGRRSASSAWAAWATWA